MSEYTDHLDEQHDDDPAPKKKGPLRDVQEVTVKEFLDSNPWAIAPDHRGDAWVNALGAIAFELWKGRRS